MKHQDDASITLNMKSMHYVLLSDLEIISFSLEQPFMSLARCMKIESESVLACYSLHIMFYTSFTYDLSLQNISSADTMETIPIFCSSHECNYGLEMLVCVELREQSVCIHVGGLTDWQMLAI